MTTILPGNRSPFEAIMEQVGAGLSKTLPDAVKDYGQRQRSVQSIDDLQRSIESARDPKTGNVDMAKVLPSIAKTYANNPSFERSGLGQQFIAASQRSAGAKDFPVGEGHGSQSFGGSSEGNPAPKKSQAIGVAELVPPRQPKQGNLEDPESAGDFELPYGPDEIAQIRQKARQNNYMPELEERFVNDALEYNDVAERRRKTALENYQQKQQERRDTLENQNAFETYLSDHAPEFAKNKDELELALKASEKHQKEGSFAKRLSEVKKELRPYQAAKNELDKALSRPLFGQTKEQRDMSRKRAQFMIEAGQKPQLQAIIAKNGYGEAEEADLINPLPEDYEKGLKSFAKFVNPFEKVTTLDPDSPKYMEQLSKGSEMRLKQRDNVINYLSKEIRPGADYDHPGTNLLLTRYHIMDKTGADWQESGQMIDDAIERGQIQLDPQQQIDYQKLAIPPLTGDGYMDTILNNVLFPITGKQ